MQAHHAFLEQENSWYDIHRPTSYLQELTPAVSLATRVSRYMTP
ncbi:hypothetical protein [Rubritalea tangerina]